MREFMIDFDVLLKILPVFILVLVSPGPDFFVVTTLSLKQGHRAGVKAAAGIAFVNGAFAAIGLMGLALVFERYFWLTVAIKICGGIYLMYLGGLLWKASFAKQDAVPDALPLPVKGNAFATGALSTLTNPKAIAFYASIFALALTPETSGTTKLVLVVSIPVLALAWFAFVAFGFSRPSVSSFYERWRRALDRVSGSVMVFFGTRLLLTANK